MKSLWNVFLSVFFSTLTHSNSQSPESISEPPQTDTPIAAHPLCLGFLEHSSTSRLSPLFRSSYQAYFCVDPTVWRRPWNRLV